MLDITVPHSPDLQDCGLRVLQYQEIIGTAVARQPDILDGPHTHTGVLTYSGSAATQTSQCRLHGQLLLYITDCHTPTPLDSGTQTT